MSIDFTNRLSKESSPYLLQHAHNPVDWYPWGEEALQKALKENKPILISIGYAACHWCHVMERESFEKQEVADIMNAYFINIKIDREERPDLDHIYMDAVQAIAGNGGWPLNVFLTPGCKPFYGGTYFPPVKAYGRASWKDVLEGVNRSWMEKRQEIEEQAENLTNHLKDAGNFGLNKVNTVDIHVEELFTRTDCDTIFENLMLQADKEWGGFGKAPKFPQTFSIRYLLEYHHYTGNPEALEQAILSLDKMLEGGIYDQVGGGLSRYSTDTEWLAPHFEKMLYDNALFLMVLCDAWQLTKNEHYKKAIQQTIVFVQRELMDGEGGFYAALDADSEGVEGKYYTWQKKEVEDLLEGRAALFCDFFDISEKGNWEHINILRMRKKSEIFAGEHGMDHQKLESEMERDLDILFAARNKRTRPQTDDKILLGWNAMMITALCKAAGALGIEEYGQLAEKTFQFILSNFRKGEDEPEFYHTYKKGKAQYPAFLDDYACLIEAAICLQEITGKQEYLLRAEELAAFVIKHFSEKETGYFFYTHEAQADLIVRKKEVYDGAVASGNSLMAENLIYLSIIFNKPGWQQLSINITGSLLQAIVKYPGSFGGWARVVLRQVFGIYEIVIIGLNNKVLRNQLLEQYLPNKVFQSAERADETFPLLAGKFPANKTLLYYCKNYTCKAPVETIGQLTESLKAR